MNSAIMARALGADGAGRQPPARLCAADRSRGGIAGGMVPKQAETGGAAARHARQQAARLAAQRGQHVARSAAGCGSWAPPGGCCRCAAGRERPRHRAVAARHARAPASRRGAEDGGGRQRQAGIDQQRRQRRQAGGGLEPLADAAHPRRSRPARQTGTSAPSAAPIAQRASAGAMSEAPQPSGRAAPPRHRPSRRRCPAATGRCLSRRIAAPAPRGRRGRQRAAPRAAPGCRRRRASAAANGPSSCSASRVAGASASRSPNAAKAIRLSSRDSRRRAAPVTCR